MTWNLAQTMSLIKAAQHKYTHRKMIGRDPKTNRIRYRYYYTENQGGGITSANIEEGSAFKLTWRGRRGHFHVQRVEGDKVFVKHDGRPNAKEVEMTKSELGALLKRQHETIESTKREKTQEARRKGRKKPVKKKTQAPREQMTETAKQGAEDIKSDKGKPTTQPTAQRSTTAIRDQIEGSSDGADMKEDTQPTRAEQKQEVAPSSTRGEEIRQQALRAVTSSSLRAIETQPFADLNAGQKALDLNAGANALESQMRNAGAAEKKELKARVRKARQLANQLFHYDRAKDMVRETIVRRARGENVEMPRGNEKLQTAIDQVIEDAKQRGSSWLMKE